MNICEINKIWHLTYERITWFCNDWVAQDKFQESPFYSTQSSNPKENEQNPKTQFSDNHQRTKRVKNNFGPNNKTNKAILQQSNQRYRLRDLCHFANRLEPKQRFDLFDSSTFDQYEQDEREITTLEAQGHFGLAYFSRWLHFNGKLCTFRGEIFQVKIPPFEGKLDQGLDLLQAIGAGESFLKEFNEPKMIILRKSFENSLNEPAKLKQDKPQNEKPTGKQAFIPFKTMVFKPFAQEGQARGGEHNEDHGRRDFTRRSGPISKQSKEGSPHLFNQRLPAMSPSGYQTLQTNGRFKKQEREYGFNRPELRRDGRAQRDKHGIEVGRSEGINGTGAKQGASRAQRPQIGNQAQIAINMRSFDFQDATHRYSLGQNSKSPLNGPKQLNMNGPQIENMKKSEQERTVFEEKAINQILDPDKAEIDAMFEEIMNDD